MAGSSTPTDRTAPYAITPDNSQRSNEDLGVGKLCSDPSCNLVDFLPLKCNHCGDSFCQEHFLPTVHNCNKWDRNSADRHPIECPLCRTPITIPPGEDPNVRIGRHLDEECETVTGKTKKPSTPVCARPRCRKLLWQPIKCEKCHKEFCATHRYPDAHTCTSLSKPTPKENPNASTSRLFWKVPPSAARSAAAAAAMARQAVSSRGPSSSTVKVFPSPATVQTVASSLSQSSSGVAAAATSQLDTLTDKVKSHLSLQDRFVPPPRSLQIKKV